jgi:hypothetical protein
LWRLEKPAYGLGDSGRLWFLTSFRTLKAQKLRPCPYDLTVFASNDSTLYVTTQVDSFIYTGTEESMEAFAHYMKSQFQLSELEFDNFSVFGTLFTRNNCGITMSQGDKINELKEFYPEY